jgi:hypothetical protein
VELDSGGAVVGVRDVFEGLRDQLLAGMAGHLAECSVDASPAPVEADECHSDRSVLKRLLEQLPRLLQGPLGLHALVDVGRDGADAVHVALAVAKRRAPDQERPLRSVG